MEINKKNTVYYAIGIVIFLLLASLVVLFLVNKTMTKKEKESLITYNNSVSKYLDKLEATDVSDLEKKIFYAVHYNYNENSKITYSYDDLVNIINDLFLEKVSKEDILQLELTPFLNQNYIELKKSEELVTSKIANLTYRQIAAENVNFYYIKKIKKKSMNKYVIIYNKYNIDNPYQILNYYQDINNNLDRPISTEGGSVEVETDDVRYDTSIISDYLKGQAKLKDLKDYCTEEDIKKMQKESTTISVQYVKQDGKYLIDKIK